MSLGIPFGFFGSIGLDPDASAYFGNVQSTGSSINSTVKNAVNKFITNLKKDGIWNNISEMGLLCGVDTYQGTMAKMKYTTSATCTRNGNVSFGNYIPTGFRAGLSTGGVSGTNVKINYSPSNIAPENSHISVFITDLSTAPGTPIGWGTSFTGAAVALGMTMGTTSVTMRSGSKSSNVTISQDGGFFVADRANTSEFFGYLDGTQIIVFNTSAISSGTHPAGTDGYLFSLNGTTNLSTATLSFWSVGTSFEGNAGLFNTHVQTLMSDIGISHN